MADPWAEYRIPSTSPRKATRSLADEVYDDIAESALKTDELKRQREAVAAASQANNPDQAAKARNLARRRGVAPEVVENDMTGYEQEDRMDRAATAAKDSRLAAFLNGNANIASDDIDGIMGVRDKVDVYKSYAGSMYGIDTGPRYTSAGRKEAFRDTSDSAELAKVNDTADIQTAMARGTAGQIKGSLRAGTASASAGLYGTAAAVAGLFGADNAEATLREASVDIRQYADENRGRSTSFVRDSLYGGVESIPLSVSALATGGVGAGLALFGMTAGGQEYVTARERGLGVGDSIGYGASQGMIEVAFEKMPLDELLKVAGGGGVKNAIKRFVVGEALGEQATTALQDLNEWVTLNPDQPFSAYVAARPEAAARTFLGTLSGSAPQVAVALGMRKALGEQTRLESSAAQLTALDEVMAAAADSKVRGRDPAAFKALIDGLAGDNDNIYVPASVIAAYNQDYRNDEFWQDYAADIDEGVASGGDISIPLSVAAARLAGTDTWEAIKGDVRTAPNGSSLNEVEQANKELDDIRFEAEEAIEQGEREARREAVPGERLRQSVRDRLMNTGMTPEMAQANAELVAALFETRAANQGREVTGREFDPVSVQRVLPEMLATEPADTLDLVINAMRQGKDAVEGVGPSLLDFIKKRGGINDSNGEVSAVGMPKRLLRDFDADQGALAGVSGAGDYGLDTTLRAAIAEGFFPQLVNVENQDGPSELDTQVLLDAIEQEVGGQKVFAETREDMMRAGAEELRQLLSSNDMDPETATDAEIREMLEQSGRQLDQEGQGQIQFTEAGAIIKLFESANASTFQHEMAHYWLEQFKSDASGSADWETLKAYFEANGHEVGDTISEGAHELFARTWERYLMEGKSPSTRLNSVFRKFAVWMKSVYRAVKGLNAPITPEVREVMDRMLATEEEIALKSDEQATMLMFDDALAAGMSEAEAKRYAQLGDDARGLAEEELLGKVMRSIRARETKAWREQERGVRETVTAAVEGRPMFRALAMLREKDGQRLDKEWLEENYGKDSLKLLPAGMPLYAKNGANADMLAEMAGFRSGDEMVRALMGLEQTRQNMKESGDKRTAKAATIDYEVAQEMHERFGDPLNDGTIEREALAAVSNELHGEKLAMELAALGRKVGKSATPYKLAREWAREKIARGVVAESISGAAQQRYARTAAKASREAIGAFVKGDDLSAFRAKQTEMLHNALSREASDASEKVGIAVARMDKLSKQRTVKTLAQDYLDRIHGLLEEYEFKRVSQRQLNARDAYAAWAQEQSEAGRDVVAVERLAQKKNWSRVTVEELLALNDAVKQIQHIGRMEQKLLDGKAERDFNEVVGEAIMALGQLPQKPPASQFGGETTWQWIKNGLGSLHSVLVKMEEVFDHLDSENSGGVFNRIAFRPIVEAQERERTILDDMMGRLIEAMKVVPRPSVKRWQDRRVITELIDPKTGEQAQMLGEELLVMALNMGNRGNMEKLLGGFGWDKQHGGMEQAQKVVLDVLNRELTADDWIYVQTVWDTIDELWPEISALEKRVNGFAPDKVEAASVTTTIGPIRGGYFPVVYDPESKVGQRNLEVEEKGLFPSSYFRSTTRAGSTKERTEFKGPLHLSLGVINRHVAEVVHDITHREAVMNADKFLSDARVQAATEAVLGPQVVKQFRPWLQHVANEWAADREGNSQAESFLKATRTNATVVGLGFRISTMMLQISGYSNSIERVGLPYVVRGIGKMLNPSGGFAAWDFAFENSKELASRMTTMDRDIRDNARKLATRQGGLLSAAQRFAFHGIGYMDRIVSTGTWLGAYDKAIAQGRDNDSAVYDADKSVRQSQGSGAAKDMARVQRGTGKMGEAWKLSTMFYSYSSAFYQRQYRLARNTSQAIRDRDAAFIPEFSARVLWLFLVPSVLAEILAGRGPEDEEDEAAWALGNIITSQFQAIPFGREIVGGLKSGFGYSYTPAEGFGKSIVATSKDVHRVAKGEETKRATRNFLEMVGYTTGKVPGQLATTAQFFVDVGYGEQDPETAYEWWRGITKGKTE